MPFGMLLMLGGVSRSMVAKSSVIRQQNCSRSPPRITLVNLRSTQELAIDGSRMGKRRFRRTRAELLADALHPGTASKALPQRKRDIRQHKQNVG